MIRQTCTFWSKRSRGKDQFYADIFNDGCIGRRVGPFTLPAQARMAVAFHSQELGIPVYDRTTGERIHPPTLNAQQIDQLRVCGRALAEFLAKGVPGSHHPLHHVKETLRLLRTLGVAA